MRRRQFLVILGSMAIGYPTDVHPVHSRRHVSTAPCQDIYAGASGSRLDGLSECSDRLSLARWRHRTDTITREGADRLKAGCARRCRASANGSIAASDPDNPHRLRNVRGPCRRRYCRELGTTGRQYHWLLLRGTLVGRQVAGAVERDRARSSMVTVIFGPETTSSTSYLHAVETAARLFSVEATGAPVYQAGGIEFAISSLVREPGGGLIVLPGAFTASHHNKSLS